MDFNAFYLRNKFWLLDFLKGSPIGHHYMEIKYLSEHSAAECNGLRELKLGRMLSYARDNCSYYRGIDTISLSGFPVVNKSMLIRHHDEIAVSADKIPGQVGAVHIQTTSGSTGIPFAVPQDTQKRLRRIAELKYFGKIVGFNTHEKLVHLRTWNRWQMKTARQIRQENIVPFDIADMGDERLRELCDLIYVSKAVCVRGYSSSIGQLARYVEKHPMSFPFLKVCIAGSEALFDDVRADVKQYMHCEIISQYANEECGILAQERVPTHERDNVMYFNHASYYLELLRMDSDEPASVGELGRIVITDMHNYAFPIIRYDTGDVGVLGDADSYSNGYPVLTKLYGRRLDVCYTVDGKPFSPMLIGRIMKHYGEVAQWQFIQRGQAEYSLKVAMHTPVLYPAASYLSTALDEFRKVLGMGARIDIETVDDIPVLSSGKRKAVVNEWNRL